MITTFQIEEIMSNINILFGAPGMNRTCDTRIRNPVLYPLSYGGLILESGEKIHYNGFKTQA